jgi:hypothetical protein
MIFTVQTTGSTRPKLGHNGHWMVPFQTCVRQVYAQTNMTAKLTLDPMEKHIQRYSSLKQPSQLELNLVLGWSPFKIVSGKSGSDPRRQQAVNIV